MKRIFKTIPAALALIALTSCSNDDLFGSRSPEAAGLKTLDVTVEQLNDGTLSNAMNANRRAANVGEGNTLIWQNEDVITVYDDKLFLYDPYEFNGTSFVIADDKHIVETPQFAVFPNTYFKKGSTSYDRDEDKVFVTANITKTMNYGKAYSAGKTEGSSYVDYDGKAAYVSLLPMWGTAKDEGSKVAVNLKYMTAILKVTLTNAMGNVEYLHVRAYQDIAHTKAAQLNGDFTADLSSSGRTPLASTKLVPTMTDAELAAAATPNVLDIDIRNINKATSIIYVPIPATHYGLVQVWADNTPSATKAHAAIGAANKIYEFVDKTFEVKFYGSLTKKVFDVDGSTVAKLNALLKANASESGDELVLDCTSNATDASTDNVITVPAMAAANVELKLKDIINAGATIAGEDFTGKLILNLTNATVTTALTINLPNADVVLKGSNTGARTITIENAKTVTFGDGTAPVAPATETTNYNAATITLNAEVQGEVKVAKFAKVNSLALAENHRSAALTVEGEAGALTVNPSANVTATTVTVSGKAGAISTPNDASTITVSGEAGALTVAGTGAVTVSGKLGANTITMSNANAGDLTISGAPVYDGTYAKVAAVTTKGNVTINLSNEGVATSGTLTMTEGKTLTLTQGYVKEIASETATSATAPKKVTVALGTDDNYKNVVISNTNANVTVTGTTKWNGEVIGGSVDEKAEWEAAGLAAAPTAATTAWAAYKDAATAVYTATGLAMNKGAFTLKNNIDLNEKAWIPVATSGAINGGGFTISNLTVGGLPVNHSTTLPQASTRATEGFGLFKSVGHDVTSLTLSGVTINAAAFKASDSKTYPVSNLGALAGLATADVTITKVKVENATIASTGGAYSIAGLIGKVNASTTTILNGVTVNTSTFKGYKAMGGFVGYASGNVTIADGAAATLPATTAALASSASGNSFTANYNSATTTPAIDKEYLRYGNFIGTAATGSNINITCAATSVSAALTSDTSIFPGYTKFNEGVNFYDFIFGQHLIGYCGDTGITTAPVINTKSYPVYATKAAYDAVKATAPEYLYYINK